MEEKATKRQGPLWDMIEGRIPGPPVSRHLGWKCRHIDIEAGTISVEFVARPEFLNPAGHVQGGFLAAMLDDAMAPLIHATLDSGQYAPTLELKVNFLRPAVVGPILGQAKIVHRGRSVGFLEGELRDPDQVLLATATATVSIQNIKKKNIEFKG